MWSKFVSKVKLLGVKGVLQMHLGFLCCAVATVIFLSPARMVSGGATGLAIFLNILVPKINYYIFLYGINILLLLISFPLLGKEFTIKSIYGSIMLPTFGALVTWFCEVINFDIGAFIANSNVVLVVMFSAFLMGFGIGINMRLGGSTGGFDILEAILVKYFHISFSTSIIFIDATLIILGMIYFTPTYNVVELTTTSGDPYILKEYTSLFKDSLSEGMCALTYVLLLGNIVDIITYGGYNKRAVYIRSNKYEEIHDEIINTLYRGLTYVDAEGGYSLERSKLIICICYSREYFILRDIIAKIDPNAFIFVTKATEVRGLGFSFDRPVKKPKNKKV